MKILFIGNSFSQDATRYIQAISEGELFVRNLYIGGCSLEMHAKNIAENNHAYSYETDAVGGEMVSINDALCREVWDVVSVQQVSGLSGKVDSYEPYLGEIISFIRNKCPNAKIVFHRTWAYEKTSTHPDFPLYGCDSEKMLAAIVEASSAMAEKYSLPVIPTGNAVREARALPEFDISKDGVAITRDGFHLSLDYGRYLAGLVLYKFFTKKSPLGVKFAPEGTCSETVKKLQAIADCVLK